MPNEAEICVRVALVTDGATPPAGIPIGGEGRWRLRRGPWTRKPHGRREIVCQDLAVGLQGVIVIDDITLGPGLGGVRFKHYASMAHARGRVPPAGGRHDAQERGRRAAVRRRQVRDPGRPAASRPGGADAPLRRLRGRRRRRLPARRGHGHRRRRPGADERVRRHRVVRDRGPLALDRHRRRPRPSARRSRTAGWTSRQPGPDPGRRATWARCWRGSLAADGAVGADRRRRRRPCPRARRRAGRPGHRPAHRRRHPLRRVRALRRRPRDRPRHRRPPAVLDRRRRRQRHPQPPRRRRAAGRPRHHLRPRLRGQRGRRRGHPRPARWAGTSTRMRQEVLRIGDRTARLLAAGRRSAARRRWCSPRRWPPHGWPRTRRPTRRWPDGRHRAGAAGGAVGPLHGRTRARSSCRASRRWCA